MFDKDKRQKVAHSKAMAPEAHAPVREHRIPSQGQRSCSGIQNGDRGFTLVELLIVIVILPLIVGAISVALLATFRVQAGVSDRLSASGDTQVVSTNFFRDVHNAADIFAPTNSATVAYPQCGTTPPILTIYWAQPSTYPASSPSNLSTVVSYSVSKNGFLNPNQQQYKLVRSFCSNVNVPTAIGTAAATAATTSTVIAENVPESLTASINLNHCASGDTQCAAATTAATNGFICLIAGGDGCSTATATTTYEVNDVTLTVLQAPSTPTNFNPTPQFSFTLDAIPRNSNGGGSSSNNFQGVSPLEILGFNALTSCASANSTLNVNGPAVFFGGTSGRANMTTSLVYFSGSPPSQTFQIRTTTPTVPYSFFYLPTPKDPLSGMPAPSLSTPTNPPPLANGDYQPGTYTTTLGSGTLLPGVYVFSGASAGVSIPQGGTLTGNDVMLYFTNGANLDLSQQHVTIALTPPPGGPYQDVSIWEDKSDTATPVVGGTVDTSGLTGIIYMPQATLKLDGGATFFASNLVVNDITCNGNDTINLGYTATPQTAPGLIFKQQPPGTANVGDTAKIQAKSTIAADTNAITYAPDPTSTADCEVSGSTAVKTVTFKSPGKCIIDASQLGGVINVGGSQTPYYAAYDIYSSTDVS